MRELSEKEMALVAGGGQSSASDDYFEDPTMPDIGVETGNESGSWEWLGTNGGYTGPTWTSGDGSISVTVGGALSGGAPSVGGAVTITF